MSVGIAISGGGHRATLWGWGALLALAETGANGEVVSIASVSGGSITNGAVANAGDYSAMSATDLEAVMAPGLRIAARDGLFFFGPATNGYVTTVFGVAALAVAAVLALLVTAIGTGREWPAVAFVPVGLALAALAWLVWLRKGRVPAPLAAVVTVDLLLGGPLMAAFIWASGGGRPWHPVLGLAVAVAITAVLATAALKLFGRRSLVVDQALGETLLSRDGRPTTMAEVDSPVHHVFCATELQSGDQVYMSPRLVYGYRVGRGTPGDLHLSTAVQCSSCLPGAFVARELDTAGFRLERPWAVADDEPAAPPALLVVNDGGVYDNMADQWEQGYHSRRRRLPDLEAVQPRANMLVVVNASKALGWSPLRRAQGLAAEIRGLTRTVDILYDVSTSHRRQGLVTRFSAAGPEELDGCLVHIAQSPFSTPKAFARSGDEATASRAREALDLLEALGAGEEAWDRRAERSPQVPTVLSAVGEEAAADLLEHAFLLTALNSYVVLGLGALPSVERCRRERFENLVRQA